MRNEHFARDYPSLARLYHRQFELTPQYAKGLTARVDNSTPDHLAMTEQLAGWVITLAGENLDTIQRDYDWICQMVLREEIYFRRNNSYRLKTFQQALDEVYSNDEYMEHYMNGLLISQIWWANHTESFRFYRDKHLGGFTAPFDHLEIGPGHGLLLFLAAQQPHCRSLEAWDISQASANQTRHALDLLGLKKPVNLRIQDLFEAHSRQERYDSIVLSEVLEHLETPREALEIIRSLLKPDGRLLVNVPINSPASDHLFLLRSPEEAVEFIENCGYRIEQTQFEPQTGMTLERARRMQATITTLVIASPR